MWEGTTNSVPLINQLKVKILMLKVIINILLPDDKNSHLSVFMYLLLISHLFPKVTKLWYIDHIAH